MTKEVIFNGTKQEMGNYIWKIQKEDRNKKHGADAYIDVKVMNHLANWLIVDGEDENGLIVNVIYFARTMMGVPPEIMIIEDTIFRLLRSMNRMKLNGNILTIKAPNYLAKIEKMNFAGDFT